MVKKALLIGVSEYQPGSGLKPLPAAARDVKAISSVLKSEMSEFAEADVEELINPNSQQMRMAIERLFSNRQRDDLILLYFSGHGKIDGNTGILHLAACETQKSLWSTMVEAGFVHGRMSWSLSKHQVVILDCCYSGAFAEGMTAKEGGFEVDIKAQLGGEGRAVLTSSTSTQFSYEQEAAELSIYTRYLVEGIETGAADLDSDGQILIDELHKYASSKVQNAAPAMKPKIYAVEEGYRIVLARAPINDPELIYRKEVGSLASQGEISSIGRNILTNLQRRLGLSPERATAIEAEVLKPYQEYQQSIKEYERVLVEALRREYPLSDHTRSELKRLQQVLKLRDEDIAKIKIQRPRWRVQFLLQQNVASIFVSVSRSAEFYILMVGAIAIVLAFIFFPHRVSSENFYKQAYDKAKNGDYQAAIDNYTQAIQLNSEWGDTSPDYYGLATAYFNRGYAHHSQSNKQAAIGDYTKAIELKPDYAEASFNRGIVRDDLGDKQGAIKDYTQVLSIKTEVSGIGTQIQTDEQTKLPKVVGVLKNSPAWHEGVKAGDQILAINGKPTINMSTVEVVSLIRGDAGTQVTLQIARKGRADFNLTLTRELVSQFYYAEAYFRRGNARLAQGDKQGAIEDYTQAIQLKPNDADAYFSRGLAHYAQGNKQGAIEDFTQAIQLKPDYAFAYYHRGYIQYRLGNYQAAIKDFTQAIQINKNWGGASPDYYGLPSAYFSRGNARLAQDNYQAAIKDFTQAIQYKSDYAEAYHNRGYAHYAQGDKQAAIKDYQKAADLYKQQGKTAKDYQNVLNALKSLR